MRKSYEERGLTDTVYDILLLDAAAAAGVSCLVFSVPGVYEAVSEYFNNEVLSHFDKLHPEEEDDDENL